ncbi:acyltransferase family protein [Agromyces sp. NPDC057679]|uniref:acyltransferase family protein n=1 Tax=Agromyces sp. NPDC057679 TaxID=3346207 RepID=UPI00366CA85D
MLPRLGWADVARAAAIALVVLYHVGGAWIDAVLAETGRVGAMIGAVNELLLTVRMPLFFLVSGMLATRALDRPFAAVRRSRILDLLWPYAIWSLAFAPCWAFAYGAGLADLPRALGWIPELSGAYWYLPALVVFFLAARAAGRHRAALLGVAVLLWLCAPVLAPFVTTLPAGLTLYRLMTFFVWFVAGATLRSVLDRMAGAPPALGLVLAVSWTVLSLLDRSSAWSITPALSLLGVTAAVMLCGAAARIPRVASAGRFLGGRTLAIYLMHPVALTVLVIVIPPIPGGDLAALVLVVGATTLLTAGPAVLRPHLPDGLFRLPLPSRRAEGEREALAPVA